MAFRKASFAWALAALIAGSGLAKADKIFTTSGGVLRGKIVKESSREVQIRDSRGLIVRVARNEIERLEKEDEDAGWAAKRAAVDKDDPAAVFALGEWAKDQGLAKEARGCFRRVLKLDPEHPGARAALGHKKIEGQWLHGEALREALAAKRAEERARSVAAAAAKGGAGSVSGARPEARPLPEEDASLLSIVRGSGPLPRREEALRALADKGGEARAALRAELEAMLAKARKKLVDHFARGKGKIRGKLAGRIQERRKAAWAIIFDKAKYPDANHGAAGQPMVDAAVGELIRAYDDPLAELAEEDDVKRLLGKVTLVAGWLTEHLGADVDGRALLAELSRKVADEVAMRRFPVDAGEAKILRQSQEIQRSNDAAKTSLTPEERACVRATNDYRMMFGLKALKVFEPLIQAARKHSGEMERLHYFDHNSPTPAKRTPAMRCQAEGASFSGENIAMGMRDGVSAFNAWYRSSGHHRNMLGKGHRSIGIGQSGTYWTQNFGYDNP
jgi:uncharacterized protein YkwD